MVGHAGEIMSVFPCGKSIRANIKYRLYFEHSRQSSKARSKFIGMYTVKRVWHLASIRTVVTGILGPEGFVLRCTEKGTLSREETDRIEGVIKETAHIFESFSRYERRFYLLDELHQTKFDKSSKYGLRRSRDFDLSNWLDYGSKELHSAAKVAAELDGQEWK